MLLVDNAPLTWQALSKSGVHFMFPSPLRLQRSMGLLYGCGKWYTVTDSPLL